MQQNNSLVRGYLVSNLTTQGLARHLLTSSSHPLTVLLHGCPDPQAGRLAPHCMPGMPCADGRSDPGEWTTERNHGIVDIPPSLVPLHDMRVLLS